MKFLVCDALCGSGKTVACINKMNKEVNRKFLFITPYLDEVERIERACTEREFISPERRYPCNKSEDIKRLIAEGRNVASTHSLFSKFTPEIKRLLREQNYTLILDEVIELFSSIDVTKTDMGLLKSGEIFATNSEGDFIWTGKDYEDGRLADIVQIANTHSIVKYSDTFYFWQIPIDIFTCFDEVLVLTYMFEYQPLKYYIEANGINYDFIGVKPVLGTYQFCDVNEMNRKRNLHDRIHIVTRPKYNAVGDTKYSLSSSWFKREAKKPGKGKISLLRKQLHNIFSYCFKAKSNDVMWTTFVEQRGRLRGKGYSNGFLAFTIKATNNYSDRHCLAYAVNVFMQPWAKNYLMRIGSKEINEDMYALSLLVQWLFRSAIRKGESVRIYIPSARMRYLLTEWIENLNKGDDLKSIKYEP